MISKLRLHQQDISQPTSIPAAPFHVMSDLIRVLSVAADGRSVEILLMPLLCGFPWEVWDVLKLSRLSDTKDCRRTYSAFDCSGND